ncbi:MAG: ABC transporter permease [bacterium]|nr:ABC transporter permease [bacterium]
MRFVWSTALKDWQRHRRDPVGLLMWIGIPILIGSLIIMASGGRGGVEPKVQLLVADVDDSFVSNALVAAMGQMGGLIETEPVTREDGQKIMDDGKASALLVIPEGFGLAFLEEKPTTLELLTNPSQQILPGIAEETLSILVDASFYAQRLVGEDLQSFAQGPSGGANTFPDTDIMQFSSKVNRIVDNVSNYLSPMIIALEKEPVVEPEDDDDDDINISLLFLPSILFMSLLFMAQGIALDLWTEKDQMTLRRVVTTPQNTVRFLSGKLLGGAGVMAMVCSITLIIGYAYFDLRLASLPLAILWSTLSGVLLMNLMMVIQVHAASRRGAGILTTAILFPLMMVGGSFFPFEAMPPWMVTFGKLTPNGWALSQLKLILFDDMTLTGLGKAFTGLVLVVAVLFAATARRLRSGFAQG